jgi:hypothetical protein
MIHKLIVAFSLVMLLLVQRQIVPAKDYTAERFDASIMVKEGGSLSVTETVTFKFVGGPFTYVYRNIPTDKTDGITIMSASMDDQTMQHGSGAGQVEIAYGNPVKVTWHFAPVSDQIHTFVLNYQVLGVFQKAQNADVLNWLALPTDYAYAISSSTITVSYPEQAILIGIPEVVQGSALVTTTPGTVVFSAHDLKPNTRLEIGLKFRSGSVITQAPQWQRLQELSLTLIPPFLLGGLAIFVVGSLIMIWYDRRYRRRPSIIEGEEVPVTAPPDDIPPAIAGALLIQTPNWNNALSTLFDLAKREVLSISQEIFEHYLMYAATFGFAEKWVKYFQKQGMAVVPLWFHSLATTNVDNLSNFVTMIAISHAVGGSSGAG